jgi:MoxR-like ATPase
MKLKVKYPNRNEEREIINRFTMDNYYEPNLEKILSCKDILRLREEINGIYIDDNVKNYVLDIVLKTREKSNYIACGASPRASINLIKSAKGRAFLEGRDYVVPDDIKSMAYDVLRHRILLSYEAEADNITSEDIIAGILEKVNLP